MCVLLRVCRFEESPVALLPDAPALEDDVVDSHNWQETVAPQVLASLCPREVDRQAVIYGKQPLLDLWVAAEECARIHSGLEEHVTTLYIYNWAYILSKHSHCLSDWN